MAPRRLLALDGGGVRGLAILLILQLLMERINPENPPKPCEVFDLIGGTSTGGIIAIMLGRLEMDVQSAIEAYLAFSASVFQPKRKKLAMFGRTTDFLKMNGRFSGENLERCAKDMVKRHLGDEDAKMAANDSGKCKVFVCAIRRENAQPVFLRSYRSTHGHEVPCTIWEACRATAAATSLFDPIKIGPFNEEFVDGAFGFNNPVNEVLVEARDLWPETLVLPNIGCIVSIGSGLRATSSFEPSVVQVSKTLVRIATETENTAERFHRAYPTLASSDKYFRFNVQRGMEEVNTSEHEKISILAAATRSYLALESSRLQLDRFLNAIKTTVTHSDLVVGSGGTISLPVNSKTNDTEKQSRVNKLAGKPSGQPPSLSASHKSSRPQPLGGESSSAILEKQYSDISQTELNSHSSMKAWLASYGEDSSASGEGNNTQKGKSLELHNSPSIAQGSSLKQTSAEAFADRFTHVKRLVQTRGPIDARSGPEAASKASDPFSLIPKSQFTSRQPMFEHLQHLVKNNDGEKRLHLIISGLGPAKTKTVDYWFPRNATLYAAINRLRRDGFGDACGFSVPTERGQFDVKPMVPKVTANPVTVTNIPSSYDITNGYSINQDERLIDFYNRRFENTSLVDCELFPDHIAVQDLHTEMKISIEFKRTIRIPDDGTTYDLPPPLASFPLLPTRPFSAHLPPAMVKKGGLFLPMLQREAFMIAFSSEKADSTQFAVRIFTGAVNALTGQVAKPPGHKVVEQDYVVVPEQKLVPGYRTSHGVMKQFLAMPMGNMYSVESQVTAEEFIGGVQFEFVPLLRRAVRFFKFPPKEQDTSSSDNSAGINYLLTPRQLGFFPGQRLFMEDKKPDDLYEFGKDDFQKTSDLITPNHGSPPQKSENSRMSLIRELYDGPRASYFDISTSLHVSVVCPIEMLLTLPKSKVEFKCSPYARLQDIRDFVKQRTNATRKDNITLIIGDKEYPPDCEDLAVGDLGLIGPQTIGMKIASFDSYNMRLGATKGSGTRKGKTESGWDMGVAMGGRIGTSVTLDKSPELWNWSAARVVNVQILNAVAFKAVTGLFPPICPISFSRHLVKGASAIQKEPPRHHSFVTAKSVSALDEKRGTTLDVEVRNDKVVLCVCCESSICDSLLDPCGHIFCGRCIGYYMTENKVATCVFCSKTAVRIIRFGAPTEVLSPSATFSSPERKTDYVERYLIQQQNETSSESEHVLDTLNDCIANGVTAEQLEESIKKSNTSVLQILLGQITHDASLLGSLNVGYFVRVALLRRNREAWEMLLPLYELVGHEGVQAAKDSGVDIYEEVRAAATANTATGHIDIESVCASMGVDRIRLLRRLGILSFEMSWAKFESVVTHNRINEMKLLLALLEGPLPTAKDKETLLHRAIGAEIAQLLYDAGSPIDALDADGNTTISKAAAYGRVEVLKFLLKKERAKDVLDRYNKFGKTAVHYAGKKPEVLALLIEAGADPDLPQKGKK